MKPRKKLKKIIKEKPTSIQAFVAEEALDHENLSHFFNDLSSHGCISGMVGSLIYYHQTHQFFDCHYEDINDLRLEYEENTGLQIQLGSDLKNTLAWFAFEETAFQLGNELGLL
ncbi:MAG: hypothetical protein JJ971_01920 [Balneolaceae bacterium]|nr:hypothetical protein [Balneolaceae bacterium]MBO6545129.1 hypothetical protein [Balneolaceae bacterium]MBO6646525.1 hypothetical protein [Balneolaceae bacterium]